jgi:hypothetical protein
MAFQDGATFSEQIPSVTREILILYLEDERKAKDMVYQELQAGVHFVVLLQGYRGSEPLSTAPHWCNANELGEETCPTGAS